MTKLFQLNGRDFLKGLVVTVVSAVLTLVLSLLNSNGLEFSMAEWQQVGVVALTAGLSYLLKNFASDKDGMIGGKL